MFDCISIWDDVGAFRRNVMDLSNHHNKLALYLAFAYWLQMRI